MKNYNERSFWSIFGLILLFLSIFFLTFLLPTVILPIILNTKLPLIVMTTPSMEPTYNVGDLLIVNGVDPADIRNGTRQDKSGDVIVFYAFRLWESAPDIPVIHRVIGKWFDQNQGKWFFNTSGDANVLQDPEPIPENYIYGVVWGSIPYIGWVKIILGDLNLFIPVIIVLSIIIVIELIWSIIRKKQLKRGYIATLILCFTSLIFYLVTFLYQF